MADDGKIYITISDKRSGRPGEPKPDTPKKEKVSKLAVDREAYKDSIDNLLCHDAAHFLKQQASTIVNYSISNIGNFTGSYQTQREIQEAISVGTTMAGFASTIATGYIMGDGAGAVAAGILAIGSFSINKALEIRTSNFQNRKQNRDIDLLRKISGLDSLTNGSR